MGLVERLKHFFGGGRGTGSGVSPGGSHTIPHNSSDSETLSPSLRKSLENAHQNPIVSAVVTWLVNQGSTTPLAMQRTPESEETEVFKRHDLLSLLRSPTEFMSGRELLSVSARDMLIKGQTFWHKDRARRGMIEGLTFMPAGRVEVKGSRERLITEYVYRPGGNQPPIPYEPEEIVHIRIEPDPLDPKNGLPPLVALARALLIEDQAEDYTSTFLTEVGTAGGFLIPPNETILTEEVAKATREYIQKEFKGSKRGTLGVLRAAMQFIRTTIDPKSVGTHETHNMVVELICAVYGVHPMIVGLGAGTAQSRVGAATKELEARAWTNRVIPLQDTIAEQIGRQLLPEFVPEDQIEEWEVTWDRSGVLSLQPDLFREAQRWAALVRAGIAMRYDGRRAQNLETDDADKVYLLPANIVPTPPGEIPARAPAPEPVEDEDDDAPDDMEAHRHDHIDKVLAGLSRQKQEVTPEQQTLFLSMAQNASELTQVFAKELEPAFDDLGARAEEAFWTVEAGATVLAMENWFAQRKEGPSPVPVVKQDPTDAEIADEVARILLAMDIALWEESALIPAWNGHTLRVLNATIDTVNLSMGTSINLPDDVARNILTEGGTRRGLIDFTEQTRASLFDALAEGRGNGEGPLQLAQRIRARVPAGPFPKAGPTYRAQLIARTETAYAQNLSALQTYKQSDVWVGVVITDGDDDPICGPVNGLRVTYAEYEAIGMLGHPNCTRAAAPVNSLR